MGLQISSAVSVRENLNYNNNKYSCLGIFRDNAVEILPGKMLAHRCRQNKFDLHPLKCQAIRNIIATICEIT